jgi:elongation factor Ts
MSADGKQAVMVEVNCETDFVAKDDNFNSFADAVAESALANDVAEVDALMAISVNGSTLEESRQALVAKIGENVQVRRFHRKSSNGVLGAYLHGGKIGVLVDMEGGNADLAKDIAMHVAALNPQFVSEKNVPAEFLAKEKEILLAQAENSDKPADIVEKMVAGRLRKQLAEITLLGQPFVKDGDISVAKLLDQNKASVLDFNRLVVGEGIEKKESNFADEVMQQVKGG